ncbi:MAG: S9 family peptidase [Acidimicrobiales bacterium]
MSRAERFGRWPSPLAPSSVASARRSLSGLASDGVDLYWVESRPAEGGRQVVVRSGSDGQSADVTPPGISVRSRVHEYGGGSFCLVAGGAGEATAVAYVDHDDQRVHLVRPPGRPVALGTPAPDGARWRHGDLRATPDGRWVLAVRERVLGGHVSHELVAISTAGGGEVGSTSVLWSGRDFVVAPRPDPSGRSMAWICWDHPDMSWDASELWVGELRCVGGVLEVGRAHRVAGGRRAGAGAGDGDGVSVGQPLWCDDGSLVYAADDAGWWQPWRWRSGSAPVRLCDDEAEFHGPDWQLGQVTMADLGDGSIACRRRRDGLDQIGILDDRRGRFTPLHQPCVSVSAVCAHAGGVAWLGAPPDRPLGPWWAPATAIGGSTGSGARPLGVARSPLVGPGSVSAARPFSFAGRRKTAVHGYFFAPKLAGLRGPRGERPPLVVICHGGPTGGADPGWDPQVQMLTTRGYAVAAVDYAGSAGYGRSYRQALLGTWGIADVDDCVDAARHVTSNGWADPDRMAIRGSSAGGFTALGALVRSDVFRAAVSWYGVTDLSALAASTHDFERCYTQRLVGAPVDDEEEYRRRSPAYRVQDMTGAVLVLQGLDDPVVPPSQADALVRAFGRRGARCDVIAFPGEGHGFRRPETVEVALRAELEFLDGVLVGR